VQKLVFKIVVVLLLVGGGLFAWKSWNDAQRSSRYTEWRQQLRDESKRNEIIAALRAELREAPDNAEAHALLGEALANAGKFSDAAVELRDAAKRHPEDVEVRVVLAQVCMRLDLIEEADRVLKEALAHANEDQSPFISLSLGHITTERYRGSAKEEDFRAARNYFQDARRHRSTEAEAMDGYAGLFLTKGPDQDFEKGIAAYRELVAKYPDYPRSAAIREMLDSLDKKESETPPPDPKEPAKDGAVQKSGGG
jgi:tetratricopeptide (TPR) repeat protein